MIALQKEVIIAGVDEAGRGPLAGPVVAAAVVLNPDFPINELNDSKRLSGVIRKTLFDLITEQAVSVGIGIVDIDEIERLNILYAALRAMKIAVEKLNCVPENVYVDGNMQIPDLLLKQRCIIKGDCIEPAIMAASIVAKVTRDQIMDDYARQYDIYGFERNKGYATPEHIRALLEFGPCPIHRRGFNNVSQTILKLEDTDGID
ncbi:MAG: ribonuclease HII [candidate division Zixibacteria bacterium]|nr:ribonuclease HII [candidate division Zixibacteria bacterium]